MNNLGRFKIDADYIHRVLKDLKCEDKNILKAMMQDVIVLGVDKDVCCRAYVYTAISPFFDEVQPTQEIPFYNVEVTKDYENNKYNIKFVKQTI